MDINECINNIVFHLITNKEIQEQIKVHCEDLSNNLVLEVELDNEKPQDYKVNVFNKQNKKDYLKNTLPKFKKIKKDNESSLENCCICLEEYKENTFKRTLKCEHHFHKKCIDKWLKNCDDDNIHCPMCRDQYSIPLKLITNFTLTNNIIKDNKVLDE